MFEILDTVLILHAAWFDDGIKVATAIFGEVDNGVAVFLSIPFGKFTHTFRKG